MWIFVSWVARWIGISIGIASAEEFVHWAHGWAGSIFGVLRLYAFNAGPGLLEASAKKLNELAVANNPIAFKLAADTMTQITGVGASSEWVGSLGAAKPSRDVSALIGAAFEPVVTNIFDVPGALEDSYTRIPGDNWRKSLNAFFGTNLLFQMRSLTISTMARMTGLESLRHLEGLHQTVNWAFGFGWLSWAVMSNYMDVTINDSMKKSLNAQILGKEMTLSQAVDAAIKGYLTPRDEKELFDINGIRPPDRDIIKLLSMRLLTIPESIHGYLMGQFDRGQLDSHLQRQSFDRQYTDQLIYQQQTSVSAAQAAKAWAEGRIDDQQYEELVNRLTLTPEAKKLEREMAEKLVPEVDLRTLWQEQQIGEADLTKAYRLQGYGPDRATQQVALLKDERRLKLRDEWLATERQLYRDCVIDEIELRTALSEEHYTPEEQDWVVKVELARRRIRTFLPSTDVIKGVKKGLIDINDAANQLQCRGWTYDDTVLELILRLEDKLPPCEDVKLQEKAMIGLLQALGSNIGVSGKLLRPNVLKYLQCLDLGYFLVPPVVTLSVTPDKLPAPGNVTLTWKATLATSAKIEPTIGPVPLEGSTTLHIAHSTGFTIHGHSPIGDSYAYAFVDVTPK